jgi:hypothetical protein
MEEAAAGCSLTRKPSHGKLVHNHRRRLQRQPPL